MISKNKKADCKKGGIVSFFYIYSKLLSLRKAQQGYNKLLMPTHTLPFSDVKKCKKHP